MNNQATEAHAVAYIEHYSSPMCWGKDMVLSKRDNSSTKWAVDNVSTIAFENPEELWCIILEILRRNPPTEVIEILAAGPLEDYLARCGERVIDRVEEQAAKDKKFRSLLGGVWQNAMSDEVWSRIQACWDRSEWDNGV